MNGIDYEPWTETDDATDEEYEPAGSLLLRALHAAGITTAYRDRTNASGEYDVQHLTIPQIPGDGCLIISDGGSAISHSPEFHDGWVVTYHADPGSEFIRELHGHVTANNSPDFDADTAAVVALIREALNA